MHNHCTNLMKTNLIPILNNKNKQSNSKRTIYIFKKQRIWDKNKRSVKDKGKIDAIIFSFKYFHQIGHFFHCGKTTFPLISFNIFLSLSSFCWYGWCLFTFPLFFLVTLLIKHFHRVYHISLAAISFENPGLCANCRPMHRRWVAELGESKYNRDCCQHHSIVIKLATSSIESLFNVLSPYFYSLPLWLKLFFFLLFCYHPINSTKKVSFHLFYSLTFLYGVKKSFSVNIKSFIYFSDLRRWPGNLSRFTSFVTHSEIFVYNRGIWFV